MKTKDTRSCLKCDKQFVSLASNNRFCSKCKRINKKKMDKHDYMEICYFVEDYTIPTIEDVSDLLDEKGEKDANDTYNS